MEGTPRPDYSQDFAPPPPPASAERPDVSPGAWPDAWRRWIIDRNPLYLLSAVLMLVGCYQLNTAMDIDAGQLRKLLVLLVTLNVYEFLVLSLALFLLKPRGLQRDATLLVIIESLFVFDATFLNAEAARVAFGELVLAGCFLLAMVKLYLVMRWMGLERSPRTLGFVTVETGLLFAMPVILQAVSARGMVGPLPFYGLWWVVGLLPVLYDMLDRSFPGHRVAEADGLRRVYTVLPWFSLVAHLGFQHWVYRAAYVAADVAPVLLGLAVIAPRLPQWIVGPRQVGAVRLALPALAILLAAAGALQVPVPGGSIGSAWLTAAGTALVWGYLLSTLTVAVVAALLVVVGLVALYGPSAGQVAAAASWALSWVVGGMRSAGGLAGRVLRAILPETAAGWGIVSIAGAFVTLGLGTWRSLRREKAL